MATTNVYAPMPMSCHVMLKHENKGKIESHFFYFRGICEYFNPWYCQIIDAGTISMHKSISHIVMHMEANKSVGGACGEIEVMLPKKKDNG